MQKALHTVAVLATAATAIAASVMLTASKAQAATGCRVDYTVTNQWSGGFGANVVLTNLGDPVNSWRVTWAFGAGQTITQLWNGTVYQSGSAVSVSNVSYNGSVGTNANTAFGFNGSWSGSNPVPTGFAMNGMPCTGSTSGPTGVPTSQPPTTPSGPTNCSASPVDPNATMAARKLLCYVYSQYGNHILSGQQESTWVSGPDYEMNIIRNASGKYPAIRGQDMGDSPDFGPRGLAWWNAGGIPMVGYHMGSPAQNTDGYSGSLLRANISAALTSGTADNQRLNQRLTGWANQLKIVQNGGGAILFRPWHEASGTWFWWSMEGASQYNRLWVYTYNFMRAQGVHNLVYLHPFNGSPNSAWYPGRQYVDIGGADTYANDHGPLTSLFNQTRNVYGNTMPIALHENGPIPDPAQLQGTATRWVLFNTWHTTFIQPNVNSASLLNSVYNSTYVVTRDEVPSLR